MPTPLELFSAFLDLFNKVWPVLAIGALVAMALLIVLLFLCLVDACRHGPGAHWSAEGTDAQTDAQITD